MSNVNKLLKQMNDNRSDYKVKGTLGEKAALEVLRDYIGINGGFIFHSLSYHYAQKRNGDNYPGNIKLEDKFVSYDGNTGTKDEVDLVLITSRRIFLIECKARSGTWKLYDHWTDQQSTKTDKSPIAQAEKHARHFYHKVYEVLPDGRPEYIIPLVVFVDKATIKDTRSKQFKQEIPVAILNTLKKKVAELDTELDYNVDTYYIVDFLKRNMEYEGVYTKE